MGSRKYVSSSSSFYRWGRPEGLRDWGPSQDHIMKGVPTISVPPALPLAKQRAPCISTRTTLLFMTNCILRPIKSYFSLLILKNGDQFWFTIWICKYLQTVWTLLKLFSSLDIEKLNKQNNEWKLFQAKCQEDSGL